MLRLTALALAFPAVTAAAQTTLQLYAHHDSAAAAARRAGNWSVYGAEIPLLDSILNGHPNVRIVRARIGAHLGDTASAYASLRDFASMGLKRRIEADTDLVALRGTPSWNSLLTRIAANGAAIGSFSPAFAMPDSDFIAEDITWDPSGKRWLVSGIRRSVILSVDRQGQQKIFIQGKDKGWDFWRLQSIRRATLSGQRLRQFRSHSALIRHSPERPLYSATISGPALFNSDMTCLHRSVTEQAT